MFTQRFTGLAHRGTVVTWRRPLAMLPPAGLALVRFRGARPFDTDGAPLPTYAEEAALLRDPVEAARDRHAGTQLFGFIDPLKEAYGQGFRSDYPFGLERTMSAGEHPLVYRSLQWLKANEPSRFVRREKATRPLDWDDLLGDRVNDALRGHSAQPRDDLVIVLAGTVADGMTHRRPAPHHARPPFESFEAGVGLMASEPTVWPEFTSSPSSRLVGIVSGESVLHLRLSAHWPLIYRMLLAEGLKDEARHVARQVLPLRAFPSDRRGTPGGYYGQENPSTGEFEFYRLRQVEGDGTYPALPSPGQGDTWWEHLGTALPSRHQALSPLPGSAP